MITEIYKVKIRHILPAFLKIAFGSIIGFMLLRWVNLQFSIIDLKEMVWELWIPMVFPWIPIIIWLRPRLRILTFKKDNDNGQFGYQVFAWIIIGAGMAISQAYLTTATGKLETLKTIDEIALKENVRYYKINTCAVDTTYGGAYTDFHTSGKHNETLNFNSYFAVPITGLHSPSASTEKKYWYGIEYSDHVSNRLSTEEKEQAFSTFYKGCLAKLKVYDFNDLDHFERVPTSDDKDNYFKAIENRINKAPDNSYIILTPIKETYESRNGNKLFWLLGSFITGTLLYMLLLALPGYSKFQHDKFLKGEKQKQDYLVDMLKFLIPNGGHFITSVIIDLNILVFLLMSFSGVSIISPRGLELLHWGANRRTETMDGEWWRLLFSMFLHGGIMHLILNIFGLVLAALFIEPVFGRTRYVILYLISGLCASLASILWYDNTISVGASGAIFGLYGAIVGLLLTDAFPKETRKGIFIMIGAYIAINLVMGLAGGIDNAAHIGGLVSGAVIGVLLYKLGGLGINADKS